MQMEAVQAFVGFLGEVGISLSSETVAGKSLKTVITSQFHKFSDETLRAIIQRALQYRDSQQQRGATDQNLLGIWGSIIDEMKDVIADRRDRAGQSFQQLIALGMQGDQKAVDRFIILLVKECQVDYLFMGIMQETLDACQQSQAHEEQVYMLTYFQQTIHRLMERASQYKKEAPASTVSLQTLTVTPPAPPTTLASATTATSPEPLAASTDKSDPVFQQQLIIASDFINDTIKDAAGDAKRVHTNVQAYVRQAVQNGDDHRITALSIALEDNLAACEQAGYLNKAKLLQFMQGAVEVALHQGQGKDQDQAELEANLNGDNLTDYSLNPSTYHAPKFFDKISDRNFHERIAIPDCIDASSLSSLINQFAHGNKNNKKFKKTVQKQINGLYQDVVKQITESLQQRHWAAVDHFAPLDLIRRVRMEAQLFKDHFEEAEIWVGKQADVGAHLTVPNIRGDKVMWLCGGKQLLKLQDEELHKKAMGHIDSKDIGVNSLPADAEDKGGEDAAEESSVKLFEPESMRKKKEAAAAKTPLDELAYDPTSPTTANHAAPEGLTRRIRTHGEVEPCKLQIKAKAPLRRFSALKELILVMDTLVAQLRNVNPVLSGLYERSDVMLAVYPGNGARFANHIDNTTNDGRRLTCVCYLNPGWEHALGGQLRITEPTIKRTAWDTPKSVDPVSEQAQANPDGVLKEVDVFPAAGRVAMFYSSEVPHEVMPTFGYRYALTIWYYDRNERLRAMNEAKTAGKVHKMSQYSVDQQLEAKEFIGKLLKNNDREAADGEEMLRGGLEDEPSVEELQTLCNIVLHEISAEALEIVASITGAPSTESFKKGFPLLTTKDLQHMRALFRRMGLQNQS